MNNSSVEFERELYEAGDQIRRIQRIALGVGALAAIAFIAGLVLSGPGVFFQAYLIGFLFVLSIALGALGVAMLHYLAGGNWGYLVRRTLEASFKTLWFVALLFIPLAFGLAFLYPWARPEVVAQSELLQHKSLYLNVPFFLIRAVVYFAIWLLFARLFSRWSQDPVYYMDTEGRRRLQGTAAVGLILYILTMTFASFDWLMSLEPEWYSTIFGLLVITGQALAAMAFAILVLPLLVRVRPLNELNNPRLIRDLGAILFVTVIFWAYIAFSQYLIIYAGNIPREVIWYLFRIDGGWLWMALFVILFQFVVPFMVLIFAPAKRNRMILVAMSAMILVARLVDTVWHVAPAFSPGMINLHWLYLAGPVAMFALWVAVFAWHLLRTPQPVLSRPPLVEPGVERTPPRKAEETALP